MNTNGKVVFHGIGPGPRGYLDGFFDRFTKPKLRVRELEKMEKEANDLIAAAIVSTRV